MTAKRTRTCFVGGATVVLFGPGHLGREVLRQLCGLDCTVRVVTRTRDQATNMRYAAYEAACIDDERGVRSLLTGCTHALSTVPPDEDGDAVLRYGDALLGASLAWMGYASSTSVYGAAEGEVDESMPPAPQSPAARRRLRAEEGWSAFKLPRLDIFRLAGIYRPERSALRTLRTRGMPPADERIVNRIHVADAAAAIAAAARCPQLGSATYNVCDDMPASRSAVFKCAAALLAASGERYGMDVDGGKSQRSRWRASRRVSNSKMKRQLYVTLRYPTYMHGLSHIASSQGMFGADAARMRKRRQDAA